MFIIPLRQNIIKQAVRQLNERINWRTSAPFFLMHLAPFAVIFTGVDWFDLWLAIALYAIRMFFITAGYHRYFAHRSYKLGRVMQFIMALGGTMAAQKGVLGWAGYHREHHRYSDTENDIHSPLRGFWWSHVGWFLCDKYKATPWGVIQDFAKYPELRWLNKHFLLPPAVLAVSIFLLWGPGALVVGFFISTVALYHGTFFVNSLTHVFGRRRYVTGDTSRNSFLIALITNGEGWHNNHHHFCSVVKQGFFWWEIDLSYYILRVLSWLGLAKDLQLPPEQALRMNLLKDDELDAGILHAHWERANHLVAQSRAYAVEQYSLKKEVIGQIIEAARAKAQEIAQLPRRREAMRILMRVAKQKIEEVARMPAQKETLSTIRNMARQKAREIRQLQLAPLKLFIE